MNLQNAICWDIETFPNCFTLAMETLHGDTKAVWEISHFRDDRVQLFEFLDHLCRTQTPMIGFNNIGFDYIVLHFLMQNRNATVEQIYAKSQQMFQQGNDRFGNIIWANDRFIPQIDLFKIYHFDNHAKSTSLKYLQINMRTDSVVDMPVENGTILTKEQIDDLLIPYNHHDVKETKQFALHSLDAMKFRASLIPQFGVEVMNWNDTKIGEQTVIQRLGDEACYDRSSGRKEMRKTPRTQIAFREIIFPYVKFNHPEFRRIHNYLLEQTLRADEIGSAEESTKIVTKGVFTDLTANVGGVTFHFGVGGIHGSLERKRVIATDEWLIRDIDVASLYPSIAIVNRLAPAHLGTAFTDIYAQLPIERKKWQKEKGKKCAEANSLKLAANGVYGKSNSQWSPFYDPQYTMTVTINGQLMLCMLAERLMNVPTLQILQINTDGITYYVNRDYEPQAAQQCREWEAITRLTLEDVNYDRMWLRDVNSYIAEGKDGSMKLKGAYWTPDPLDYSGSISNSQPPAWHKDLSNPISVRAAVAHMVHGCDIEQYIRMCTNPFDFMCAVKIKKSDNLTWNSIPQQKRGTRYYVTTDGAALLKSAPAMGPIGAFKKANGVSDAYYEQVMRETGGQWDIRVCTKNQSRYETRETNLCAGYNVTICNNVKDFHFDNINYAWYVQEAQKLIV